MAIYYNSASLSITETHTHTEFNAAGHSPRDT